MEFRLRATAALLLVLVLVGGMLIARPPNDAPRSEPELEFRQVAGAEGIEYVSRGGQVTRGGGVYVADFNNDNWSDVLLLGGTARKTERGWLGPHPALFTNTGGQFHRSGALPLAKIDRRILSALFFDYDRDGWTDLLLLPVTGEPYFLANTGGEFEIRDLGIDTNFSEPTGATAADYNKDGCLDLFVYQNGDWSDRLPKGYRKPNQNVTADNGNENVLFRGTCSSFERVTDGGIAGSRWTLAASFVDVTGDGYPDIHVANDYNADYIYVNQRNGSFRREGLGPATRRNAMSSEIVDVNTDGRPDIFVTNIYFNESQASGNSFLRHLGRRIQGNNLLVNTGEGEFVDKAAAYGVNRGGWGWAAVAADLDNDGDRDLIHTTESIDLRGEHNATYLRYPAVFERVGETAFASRNPVALGFNRTDGAGLASLDYDRDGDVDLLVGVADKSTRQKFALYENTGAAGNWLQVDARWIGASSLGTRVYVERGNETIVHTKNAKADYHSQDTRILHYGLGEVDGPVDVRVVWPDGKSRVIENVSVNQRVVVSRESSPRNRSDGSR